MHPALVHIPIACWTLALAADLAGIWLGMAAWRFAAVQLTVGCLMALPAMIAGLTEIVRIDERAALHHAYLHMGLMVLATSLFTLRLLQGLDQWQPRPPDQLSVALDLGGLVCLVLGGHMGGRLVYEHGVGTLPGRSHHTHET